MATLSNNWVTEKHIDFEYKKYLLLGYLQQVSERFTETRLYPALADLIRHYRNVIAIRNNKKLLADSFPAQLKGTDLQGLRMLYEKMVNDDQIMQEIESIVEFSIPQFEKYIAEGKSIYDFIESALVITPVGIVPLHTDEGYLLLHTTPSGTTLVYNYQITIFEGPDDRYRGINTTFVCSYKPSPATTFESIKSDLIRYRRELPNPAIYAVASELAIPVDETLLPMAQRTLVRYVSATRGSC
jgi:hypothetical protein